MTDLDVAAALAPLHRAYLRRLDEMAARLPPDALLRESTTHGADLQLAFGSDGLPLVFDVADAATHETFEVRGAAPDAPACPGGTFGSVQVDLLPGNWEALSVEMVFEGRPSDRELLDLAELLRGWALLASQGAFARLAPGPLAPWSGRLHSMKLEASPGSLSATLDLGTCPPQALAVLLGALDGMARDARAIARVTIGASAA